MTLRFDAQVAARGFDLRLEVETGETVAVMGPNGAGKSTLLGLLSGLLRADGGSARLDEQTLFGEAAFTPPHRRGVTLLAQDALLFPHLTALDNVGFGPRSAGRSRAESRRLAHDWLREVDADGLADAKPGRLSGGQAQRVAVARALASQPRLLLLDEPMSALDIAAAPALRRMLGRVLHGRTAIIVTHEPLDALQLADRVVVIEHGRVVEQGPTRQVFERPTTDFMAGLAGLNLLRGTRTARGFVTASGLDVGADTADIPIGAAVAAAVRPSAVGISATPPAAAVDGSPTTVFRDEVVVVEPRHDAIRIGGRLLSADSSAFRVAALGLTPGDPVWFSLTRRDVDVYPLPAV